MDELLSRAQPGAAPDASGGLLVSALEAEQMAEQLKEYGIEEIGTAKWLEQRDWIEKLNIQAHHNAQMHADEFVIESLVSFDKISVIIHELIAIEVWKAKVLPLLKKHLAKKVDSIMYYTIFHHEAALANLLEVLLFHSHAAEAASEDAMLELADWCHRKIIYLNNEGHKDAAPPERSVKELMEQGPVEQLDEKLKEINFAVGIASLTIARYLTDHAKALPLGVVNRMANTCDVLLALIPLIDNPPWVRRHKGKIQKFQNNRWETVERSDRLKITKLDGQAWLAVNNLVVDRAFREKYAFNEFRKERLQVLRRHMNELLFDQLPVLKDLQRTVDELTLSGAGAVEQNHGLLLEAVPQMREQLMRGQDWEALAKRQKKTVFGEASKDVSKKRMEALLKTFEFMADMEAGQNEEASVAGSACTDEMDVTGLPVKLDAKRKTSQGIWVSYSNYSFSLNMAKGYEAVELKDDEGRAVKGKRYRLAAIPAGTAKALPAKGKMSVLHGVNTADALLELPAPATKDSTSDFPSVVWLTIGLLATDGLALQIKLRKNPEISERDSIDGEWYIYEPVGGAITLLDEDSVATTAGHPAEPRVKVIPATAQKAPPMPESSAALELLHQPKVSHEQPGKVQHRAGASNAAAAQSSSAPSLSSDKAAIEISDQQSQKGYVDSRIKEIEECRSHEVVTQETPEVTISGLNLEELD